MILAKYITGLQEIANFVSFMFAPFLQIFNNGKSVAYYTTKFNFYIDKNKTI